MKTQEMIDLCKQHTLYTWAATDTVNPIPVAKAEGVYFWSSDGKRYLDCNSQLMSVNIGHGHPKVVEAIQKQAGSLVYV